MGDAGALGDAATVSDIRWSVMRRLFGDTAAALGDPAVPFADPAPIGDKALPFADPAPIGDKAANGIRWPMGTWRPLRPLVTWRS